MDGRGALLKAPDEVSPVVNDQRPGLGHAEIEVVQGGQQGQVLLPVPEYAHLVVIEAVILAECLLHTGAAAGRWRCPESGAGPPLPPG